MGLYQKRKGGIETVNNKRAPFGAVEREEGRPDTYRSVYKHNKSSFFRGLPGQCIEGCSTRLHLQPLTLLCVTFFIHLSATSGKARAVNFHLPNFDLLRALPIDFPLMKSLFIRVLAQKQQTTSTSSSPPSSLSSVTL